MTTTQATFLKAAILLALVPSMLKAGKQHLDGQSCGNNKIAIMKECLTSCAGGRSCTWPWKCYRVQTSTMNLDSQTGGELVPEGREGKFVYFQDVCLTGVGFRGGSLGVFKSVANTHYNFRPYHKPCVEFNKAHNLHNTNKKHLAPESLYCLGQSDYDTCDKGRTCVINGKEKKQCRPVRIFQKNITKFLCLSNEEERKMKNIFGKKVEIGAPLKNVPLQSDGYGDEDAPFDQKSKHFKSYNERHDYENEDEVEESQQQSEADDYHEEDEQGGAVNFSNHAAHGSNQYNQQMHGSNEYDHYQLDGPLSQQYNKHPGQYAGPNLGAQANPRSKNRGQNPQQPSGRSGKGSNNSRGNGYSNNGAYVYLPAHQNFKIISADDKNKKASSKKSSQSTSRSSKGSVSNPPKKLPTEKEHVINKSENSSTRSLTGGKNQNHRSEQDGNEEGDEEEEDRRRIVI